MKKLSVFANILLYVSLGVWAAKALLDYVNYTRHVPLFAENGWFWYEDALLWGAYIIPIVVSCLIARYLFSKMEKS